MKNTPSIVFDLDGTLIDSAPAILAGLEAAFAASEQSLQVQLTTSVIGPPLMATLATLAGTNNPVVLNALADAFREHYDQSGYRQTKAFPGVELMLIGLRSRGHRMYVATNKRIFPTLRIIELLGWDSYFDHVYALDLYQPALETKSALLIQILADQQLDATATIYIGDRDEDGIAASVAGIPFLLAKWGYDCLQTDRWTTIDRPAAFLEKIRITTVGTKTSG